MKEQNAKPFPSQNVKKLKELKLEHQQFQEEILSHQNNFDEMIRIYRKSNQGSVMKDHYGSLKLGLEIQKFQNKNFQIQKFKKNFDFSEFYFFNPSKSDVRKHPARDWLNSEIKMLQFYTVLGNRSGWRHLIASGQSMRLLKMRKRKIFHLTNGERDI